MTESGPARASAIQSGLGEQPAIQPMAPDDSAVPDDEDMPDVNDGEAPKPMCGDDDIISGQYGPTADYGG